MKSCDVETSTYISFDVENNDKNLQFSIHNHAGISKYKNVFTLQISRKTFLSLKKLKYCTMDISVE